MGFDDDGVITIFRLKNMTPPKLKFVKATPAIVVKNEAK